MGARPGARAPRWAQPEKSQLWGFRALEAPVYPRIRCANNAGQARQSSRLVELEEKPRPSSKPAETMQVCAKLKDIVRFGIRGAQGKLALRYNHINESLPMEPRTTRPISIPNLG